MINAAFPPGGERMAYYFSADLQKGNLLTQISHQSQDGGGKELELSVLGPDARVANWYWIHGSGAQEEAARSFPIDNDGRTLIRVIVIGPTTGKFCIGLGGSALEGGTVAKSHPVSTSRAEF